MVVAAAGTLSPVVGMLLEDGSPSLNILQTFVWFFELWLLVSNR